MMRDQRDLFSFALAEYAVPFSPSDNTAAPAALASSPASAPAHPRQEAAAAPAPAAPATPFAAPPSPAAPMGSATSSDNALLPAALRSMLVTPAPASASSASSVSPPGGGPSAGSGALSRSLLPPAAVEQPFPSFAPSLAGTSLGAASLLPPVQPSSSSGGPSLEDVGRYFAAHEEWYRTATLKRQEVRGSRRVCAAQGSCRGRYRHTFRVSPAPAVWGGIHTIPHPRRPYPSHSLPPSPLQSP